MIRTSRFPYIKKCTLCLKIQKPRSQYSVAAVASKPLHKDVEIRDVFNGRSISLQKGKAIGGLFGNKYLRTPEGLEKFTDISIDRAKRLVERVVSDKSPESRRLLVKNLDSISDILCSVIDLAEVVRTLHPDTKFNNAANLAHSRMFTFMNMLNTNVELFEALENVMNDEDMVSSFSREEKAVAEVLYRDFKKSGINMPENTRRRFVDLSNDVADLGTRFVSGTRPASPTIELRVSDLEGMPSIYFSKFIRGDRVFLPSSGGLTQLALKVVQKSEIREIIYRTSVTGSKEQEVLLHKMLEARQELASLVGESNFGSMTLSDKMASSSESVFAFLGHLSKANKTKAQAELSILSADKEKLEGGPVNIWDREFYVNRYLRKHASFDRTDVSSYLSVGTVMQGLSRLFDALYGIKFIPVETSSGEVWDSSVKRLDVYCERDGHIGTIYCDLFQRQAKNANPAHFTIRCSRRVDNDDMGVVSIEEGETTFIRNSKGEVYQIPIVMLVCGFLSAGKNQVNTLSWHEVTTLFHEMGHALHCKFISNPKVKLIFF